MCSVTVSRSVTVGQCPLPEPQRSSTSTAPALAFARPPGPIFGLFLLVAPATPEDARVLVPAAVVVAEPVPVVAPSEALSASRVTGVSSLPPRDGAVTAKTVPSSCESDGLVDESTVTVTHGGSPVAGVWFEAACHVRVAGSHHWT